MNNDANKKTFYGRQLVENTGKVRVPKLRFGSEEKLELDQSQEWVETLLNELNEDVLEEDKNHPDFPCSLQFIGTINKKKSGKYQEVVVLRGELVAQYLTYCSTSGDLMADTIHAEVNAAVIEVSNKEKYAHTDDTTEIEIDLVEYDLYYYEDNCLELGPIFHEYLYLNKNLYPVLAEQEDSSNN